MQLHQGSLLEASLRRPSPDVAEKYLASGYWRDRTFLDDFLANTRERPDKVAVITYSKGIPAPVTVTYEQLGEMVDRIAVGLLRLGIQPADIVTIQVPNGWLGAALALATMRAGAVPNPVPITYRERELRFMVAHTQSRVLFIPSQFRGYDYERMAQKLRVEIPTLEHVFVVGAVSDTELASSFDKLFLADGADLDLGVDGLLRRRLPAPDDAAMLVFTSGTTGTPKAAVHTHNTAWAGYSKAIVGALKLTPDDTAFMASTLGHLTGFIHGMLVPLSLGQTVVYQDIWDVERLLDTMADDGITWTLSATPFAIDMIESQRGKARLPGRFRAFACGGAPVPPVLAESMEDLFGAQLVSLWGCSETGIASIHQIGADVHTLAGSDGFPVPWQETRIVATGTSDHVPAGEIGSLQVRGPGVFLGYFKQPELTDAAFTDDDWFDTGDLGRRTSDGGIRVEGRTKDIIIRGGQNISAVEIENVMFEDKRVADVAVVAYPDDRLGERVCAVVVPSGEPPTLEDIVKHVEESGMSKQFWPQRLVIVDELPRTPSGKVKKYVLAEQLAKNSTEFLS